MVAEPPRPPPQSTVQAAGQAASDVVRGLQSNPMLLAIVVLNIVAILAAIWFLRELAETSRSEKQHLLQMLEKCMRTERPNSAAPTAL